MIDCPAGAGRVALRRYHAVRTNILFEARQQPCL